jgi:phosphate transport system substrate-binding protein
MKRSPTPRPGLMWLATMLLSAGIAPTAAFADDVITHRIAGTGIALAAMRLLSEDFSATEPNVRWVVLPSLGTPGGIRALIEGEIDMALAARRLTAEELARGVQEAACFQTALVFASSHPRPSGIAKVDLPDLFGTVDRTWPDGVPIKVILRARAGSENSYLSQVVPALGPVLEAAYKRPGMPVGVTDQHNAELAIRTVGSLAIITLLQVRSERLNLRILPLDGNVATPETLENNTYPLPIPICLLTMQNHPRAVSTFVAYIRSSAAQTRLRSLGAIPAK